MRISSVYLNIFLLHCLAISIWACSTKTVDESTKDTDSISSVANQLELQKQLNERLINELQSLSQVKDSQSEYYSLDSLKEHAVFFSFWAMLIKAGDSSNYLNNQDLASQLRIEVLTIQQKDFPIIRSEYVEIISNLLWEHDVLVKISGERNSIITFTSGEFVTNKNIKDFHETLLETMALLRFKMVRYRWYKGGESTIFELETPDDDQLIIFDPNKLSSKLIRY
jgi:hypothetical protein